MLRRSYFTLSSFIMLGICASFCNADTLELKNGQIIEAVIVKESDAEYTAQCNVGIVTFAKERVASIKKATAQDNEQLAARFKLDATDAAPTVTSSPQTTTQILPVTAAAGGDEQESRILYNGSWITQEEYRAIKESKQRTWQEKIDDEKTRTAELHNTIVDSAEAEKTKELIQQGRYRRSQEGTLTLSRGTWQHHQTQNFIIFHQNVSLGKTIAQQAEYFLKKITSDLGIPDTVKALDTRRIEIFAVDNEMQWNEILQGHSLPDSPRGFTKVFKNEIFLCITSEHDITSALPHELSHLALRWYASRTFGETCPIPLFFLEGFANYYGEIVTIASTEELLTAAVRRGEHIALPELLVITDYPKRLEHKTLFYAEATKLISFIHTQHGRDMFRSFTETVFREYRAIAAREKTLSREDGRALLRSIIQRSELNKNYVGISSFEETFFKTIITDAE